VRLEGLGTLKICNSFIGTRTRDLPACGIASQPSTLPTAPTHRYKTGFIHAKSQLYLNDYVLHPEDVWGQWSMAPLFLTSALHGANKLTFYCPVKSPAPRPPIIPYSESNTSSLVIQCVTRSLYRLKATYNSTVIPERPITQGYKRM
jgi:hypothetical protein